MRMTVVLLAGFGGLVLLSLVLIGVFVWRDAKARGMNAAGWTLCAVFLPMFCGLALYLIARTNRSADRCPGCRQRISPDFVICPFCGTELKLRCPSCKRTVESNWKLCPSCGTELPQRTPPVVEKKEHWLGWVLVMSILLPLMLIGMLALSSPLDHGGFSTVQDGPHTIEELFALQPELAKDTALNEWLGQCQEDGAYLLWDRQTLAGKDGEKETLVGYLCLRGYTDAELDSNGDANYWGRVGLKIDMTGTAEDGSEPVIWFIRLRADRVGKPVVTLNGNDENVVVEDLEDGQTLTDYIDFYLRAE